MKRQEKVKKARRIRTQIKAVKRAIRSQQSALRKLEKELQQVTKMRPGGGKSKGGAYEHKIAGLIAEAFAAHGIQPDDCYRTKNSGAGKQPGDIQFSPRLREILNVVVECKHYKGGKILRQLFEPLKNAQKSWEFRRWWEQLEVEVRESGLPGLLIWRENNGFDMVSFSVTAGKIVKTNSQFPEACIRGLTRKGVVRTRGLHKKEWIWTMRLSDFLAVVAENCKVKGA